MHSVLHTVHHSKAKYRRVFDANVCLFRLNVRALFMLLALTLSVTRAEIVSAADTDPLSSWNDRTAKQAILEFVKKVTTEGTAEFVPISRRIATIDNDGTLWVEQPMYVQLAFTLDRVKVLAETHPEWRETQPFKSILENNLAGAALGGERAMLEVVTATHAGMTTDEFSEIVREWLKQAIHPRFKRPYTECVYLPMLELMDYLRANQFQVFIVTGGGVEFVRAFAESVYGVPPQNVIGSSMKLKYEIRDGQPVIMRLPAIEVMNDKAVKPVSIHQRIGLRPTIAIGNSDGDFEMLEYATSGTGARLGVVIHHTDAVRESGYDRYSLIGKLDRGLKEGPGKGWTFVSMKEDWKRIFRSDAP